MHRALVVTSLSLSLATAPSVGAHAASADTAASHELAQARPVTLSMEIQEVEHGHVALTSRFQLRDVPGELRIDLWTEFERPLVEAHFSILGVPHVYVRQVDGNDDHQVWLSPMIKAELARDAPELFLTFWAVLTDPRIHAQIRAWLQMLPPDPQRKNPLCGATKWGLKALAIAANVGCCAGGLGACIACTVGLDGVKGMINGIDCNKECRPDCPVA